MTKGFGLVWFMTVYVSSEVEGDSVSFQAWVFLLCWVFLNQMFLK